MPVSALGGTKGMMMISTKTMLKRALAGVFAIPAIALGSDISDPTPVLVDVDSFYMWRTATGGTMRVEWTFPLNATVAHLAVTGRTVKVSMPNIRTEYADVELPTPTSAKEEDVLDLTLSFNDGTVTNALLGLVRGRADDGGVTTPTACRASTNSAAWRRAAKRFVVPVPKGAETVSVAGESVDTGLGGAAGWLALGPYASGATVPVSADDASVDLWVCAPGVVISVK